MNVIYSVLLGAGLLASLPYWLVQMLRSGKYREGLGERFGRVPARVRFSTLAVEDHERPGWGPQCVWVHAVSVGEVMAIGGMVGELRARLPEHRVVVSTTTATGQKLARQRFGAENVFYFPLDFAFAIRPWLRALQPQMVVLAETEFWPNFLRLAHIQGARIAVVNARISDRSLPRYRRFRALMMRVLASVDLFLAQSEEDRRRLTEIGARAERVQVSGNLKFDVHAAGESPLVDQLRMALAGAGPVVVCGSTVESEEALLLPAFRAVLERWPRAVFVLASRHPERFEEVARALTQSGLRWWRRSLWQGEQVTGGVFLLDSIGELAATYALGQVAFVGGSLVRRGGHNVLEAAQAGAAVLVGPHTENFRDIVALFQAAGALRVVTPGDVGDVIIELLADERTRSSMAGRAAAVLRAHRGATERTATALEDLLAGHALEARR